MFTACCALLVVIALAAWADLRSLYRDAHAHQVRTDKRVAQLGDQVLKLRRENLRQIDRPVVRWHNDLEARIRAHNHN